MKKGKSIFIVAVSFIAILSNISIQNATSAKLGYAVSQYANANGYTQAATIGACGYAGVYWGAKLGAKIGWLGGPAGSAIGCGVGAL